MDSSFSSRPREDGKAFVPDAEEEKALKLPYRERAHKSEVGGEGLLMARGWERRGHFNLLIGKWVAVRVLLACWRAGECPLIFSKNAVGFTLSAGKHGESALLISPECGVKVIEGMRGERRL